MLIRTQDGNVLVNLELVKTITIDPTSYYDEKAKERYIIARYLKNNSSTPSSAVYLGKYDNSEDAQEVLDALYGAYYSEQRCFNMP